MREFADYDILYDGGRAADVKTIMEGRGFHTEQFGTSNHDIYHKKPVLNFEMHSALFKELDEEELHNYYKDIGGKLLGEGPEKHLSPEDFYLYIIAHEYKHYYIAGTGLKSLMDTYVCLKELDLDMSYVIEEAKRIGIADFEEAIRNLSIDLFDGKELSGSEQNMLDFILSSGTHGNYNTHVSYLIGNNRFGKLGYMLGRFLVPVSKKNANYKAYARSYPVFYKYKVLLPILPFYRTARAIFTGSFRKEANAIKRTKTKG